MSNEVNYGIIHGALRKKGINPEWIDLLRVPHQGRTLTVSYPAFGPEDFTTDVRIMRREYSHPITGEKISFREPTIAESISIIDFILSKKLEPKILNRSNPHPSVYLGKVVRTSNGIFVNPPKDSKGDYISDEKFLSECLVGAKEIGGVLLLPNNNSRRLRDFGFVPYHTFKGGVPGKGTRSSYQNSKKFCEGGLARALEHTEGKVERLVRVTDKESFKEGVSVINTHPVIRPFLTSIGLLPTNLAYDPDRLVVNCNIESLSQEDNFNFQIKSYLFGVLEKN